NAGPTPPAQTTVRVKHPRRCSRRRRNPPHMRLRRPSPCLRIQAITGSASRATSRATSRASATILRGRTAPAAAGFSAERGSVREQREPAAAGDELHSLALVNRRLVGVGEIARGAVVHANGDGPVRLLLLILLDLVAGVGASGGAGNGGD